MKRALVLLLLLVGVRPSLAHELQAAALRLDELGAGFVRASLKTPLAKDGAAVAVVPRFPESCEPVGEARALRQSETILREWRLRCNGGLVGREIRLEGLDPRMPEALVTVHFADGRTMTAAVDRHEPAARIEGGTTAPPLLAFVPIGIEHILFGADHLLFVLGLLLVVDAAGAGLGALVAALTAFTLAHSLTLATAVLGVWGLPARAVEVLIAASIVLLAHELAGDRRFAPSLTFRKPWLVAFGFGLLHGFGFAGALAEIGLPDGARLSALLLFNVGVELGQLAFVAFVIVVGALLRRLPLPAFAENPAPTLAPILGGVASYWMLDRLVRWSASLGWFA